MNKATSIETNEGNMKLAGPENELVCNVILAVTVSVLLWELSHPIPISGKVLPTCSRILSKFAVLKFLLGIVSGQRQPVAAIVTSNVSSTDLIKSLKFMLSELVGMSEFVESLVRGTGNLIIKVIVSPGVAVMVMLATTVPV